VAGALGFPPGRQGTFGPRSDSLHHDVPHAMNEDSATQGFTPATFRGDPDELAQGFAAATSRADPDDTAQEPHRASDWPEAGDETSDGRSGSTGPAGRTVGRYRILGPLGIGGMGVVYRAEDIHLGRTVALKFLPPAPAPDARAKRRFLDEARAASALDHPNVCTIYEVGETAAGQLYLAMACYEGETLRRRLARGPLTVAEALDIALQAARGLAKAHRRGIVHRDVKPANLMFTRDGIVKLLDFGIAKLPGQPPSGPRLGTPGYMSPEQARGEQVDARSDVWSLGAVLHEMLVGRPPEGDGLAEDAVGMGSPPVQPPRRDTPAEVRSVLSRMLATAPVDRYADAGELLADFAALQRATAGGAGRRLPGIVRRGLGAMAAGALAFLALTSARGLLPGAGQGPGPPPLRAEFSRLTDLPGRAWFPSLSPHGDFFVYARKSGDQSLLFLQRIGGGAPIALPQDSPRDDNQPAFSPDGQEIAFRSEREGGGIFLMGATGESVRRLTDFGFNPAWSPDGTEIACATEGVVNPRIRRQRRSEIFRVSVATGKRRLLYGRDAVQPSWSPHGYRVAFWSTTRGQRVVWTVPASGGAASPVTNGASLDWDPVWSPDGRFLYFASDRSGVMNLWRVPIEERSGKLAGEPEPVTSSSQASMMLSISPDGRRIAFASDDSRAVLEKVDLDPVSAAAGGAATILHTSRKIAACDASRDGRWIVLGTANPREDLLLVHPNGTVLRQLTRDGFKNREPRLSPDGTHIAFYSNRGGGYDLWTIRTDGSQLELAAAIPGGLVAHPVWSPDGKQIACDVEENEAVIDFTRPRAERRLQLLPPAGPRVRFSAWSWSPDGRWLAGVLHSPDGPRLPGIVLYSLAGRRYVRVTGRGGEPRWLSDSRRLLYRDGGEIFLLDTGSSASRRILAAPPGSAYSEFVPSPDDRSLYLARTVDEGDIWLLTME
jgi:Tol biopolymer transport system component